MTIIIFCTRFAAFTTRTFTTRVANGASNNTATSQSNSNYFTLLSNLFGFDEISDVRLRPYIEAAEQRQRDGMQQQRGRGRPTNASRGKKRGRSR